MQSDKFGGNKDKRTDGGSMTREERREIVLDFMTTHPFAMPPTVVFRGLKVEENISFSKDTVKRCLDDLEAEGQVKRVDKEGLDTGDLVEADEDARAYYIASLAFD